MKKSFYEFLDKACNELSNIVNELEYCLDEFNGIFDESPVIFDELYLYLNNLREIEFTIRFNVCLMSISDPKLKRHWLSFILKDVKEYGFSTLEFMIEEEIAKCDFIIQWEAELKKEVEKLGTQRIDNFILSRRR